MKIKKYKYFSILVFLVACILPYKRQLIQFKNPTKADINTAIPRPKSQTYLEKSPVEFSKTTQEVENSISINAESAIVIDMNNKKIIFEKNSTDKKPVASLVKIMTAIITSEYLNFEDTAIISEKAAQTGENTMELKEGEEFTVEDLTYGLILNSANDAAVALAERVAGSEVEFVKLMNIKADLIGASDTRFVDSSGLNKQNLPYFSTSLDLAKIAYYSQTNHQELKKIYKTLEWEIPSTDKHTSRSLENQTNLLRTYPGVEGLKTGYTEESGLCLITYANNEGKEIIIVILNSNDRKSDAVNLLDYAYDKLGVSIEN